MACFCARVRVCMWLYSLNTHAQVADGGGLAQPRTHPYAASSLRTWVESECADDSVLRWPLSSAARRRRYRFRGEKAKPEARGFPTRACEEIALEGGAVAVALHMKMNFPRAKIGLMVAANSGRPGGAVGLIGVTDRVNHEEIRADHKTQEEDIMSAWLSGECSSEPERNDLFRDTIGGHAIGGLWGLRQAGSTDRETIQGIDYRELADPRGYADAYVVRDAVLCGKSPSGFVPSNTVTASLVFVGGPNAGARKGPTSSTTRTLNPNAIADYSFFRDSVKAAVRAGLDAMIQEKLTIALVARISCGIYAGPHRDLVNEQFLEIVNELLRETLSSPSNVESPRGSHFRKVIVANVPPATKTPCWHGAGCRTNTPVR
jgi:hypothetical protein